MSTFVELRTALADRGFQYLTAAQLGADVNTARGLLDDMYLWPYRLATASGPAPLTVSDLGTIESVTYGSGAATYPLEPLNSPDLLDAVGDVTLPGFPSVFYVDNGVVRTYPVGTGSITVRYFKATPDLAADGDTPLSPARFHLSLLLDMAVQQAYKRTDNFQGAAGLQPFIDLQLSAMVGRLLGGQQIAGPGGLVAVGDGSCDG